jgi:hypothetical protein
MLNYADGMSWVDWLISFPLEACLMVQNANDSNTVPLLPPYDSRSFPPQVFGRVQCWLEWAEPAEASGQWRAGE